MKKLGIMITALFAVVAFNTASFAADVSVTLTSPVIIQDGCEKAGAVTFAFPAGTTFTSGDWFYMDLNTANTTICSPIDYVIADPNVVAAGGIDLSGGAEAAVFAGAGTGLELTAEPDYGPISFELAAAAVYAAPGGDEATMGFQVTAVKDSNRVLVTVFGTAAAQEFTVQPDHTLKLKILDGKAWNLVATATSTEDTIILTNILDPLNVEYGENDGTLDDLIDFNNSAAANEEEPAKENTLCINAEDAPSGTIYTSFASKADFLTFSGDSQIAHKGTTATITLGNCKGVTTGNLEPASQGSCDFTYEDGTNYCSTPKFGGNRMLVETSSTFGQSGDKYDISVEVLTDGVYFSQDPAVLGFVSSDDNCNDAGAGLTFGSAFVQWAGTDNSGLSYDATGSCAIDADGRIDKVTTSGGSLTDLWQYKSIWVDFDKLVYDTSIQGPGEVQIQVVMSKYPCGDLFSGTLTVGTFVEECTSASTTTLIFPYFPPLDNSAVGWWSGYVITNGGSGSGTIALVYSDGDGNTGTYTTASLAAGAMFNGTSITAADLSGATDFNASDNFSIVATCQFGSGVGFAFIGNGKEGTGYTVKQ